MQVFEGEEAKEKGNEGKSRGFGFVNFEEHESAVKAIEAFNGAVRGVFAAYVPCTACLYYIRVSKKKGALVCRRPGGCRGHSSWEEEGGRDVTSLFMLPAVFVAVAVLGLALYCVVAAKKLGLEKLLGFCKGSDVGDTDGCQSCRFSWAK